MEEKLKKYFATLRSFSRILMKDLIDTPSGKKFDLKLSQINAITAFKEDRALSMKALAKNCMSKLPNMTTMVNSLVKQGLAERERDSEDRRKVIVRLTPQGQKVRNQFLANRRSAALSIFSALSEEDKSDLLRSMENVCSILERSIKKTEAGRGRGGSQDQTHNP